MENQREKNPKIEVPIAIFQLSTLKRYQIGNPAILRNKSIFIWDIN